MEWIVSLTPAAGDPWACLASPPPGTGVVELRADLFPGIDLRRAVSTCPVPLLATLRSAAEGGRGPDDPAAREPFVRTARDADVGLIDLELDRDIGLIQSLGLEPERIVLSAHRSCAAELPAAAAALHAAPVRWLKAVAPAERLADLETVLSLHAMYNHGRQHQRRLITFAMGATGLPSRLLGPVLGPPLGYAAWSPAAAAAPGQRTVSEMNAVVGHLRGAPQRLFGVVGADVTGSLSPALHGAGYHALGLPYLMVPVSVVEPSELDELFRPAGETMFDRLGLPVGGWAVTTPYKTEAASVATVPAPRVRTAGVANTLVLRPGQILADTTDADGVVAGLASVGYQVRGRTALVQGTGGAARGAVVGLHLAGATVTLRGRDEFHTRTVAQKLAVAACPPGDSATAAVLVNATPLGTATSDRLPFSEAEIEAAQAVVDLVYGAGPTPLALACRATATTFVDGRSVLLYQGLAQFAAFTGKAPPKDAMRAAIFPEGPSSEE
jgi:shikimate dehydrogenase